MSRALVELDARPLSVRVVAKDARSYVRGLAEARERAAFDRGRSEGAAAARSTAAAAIDRACAALEEARAAALDAVARDTAELALAITGELVRHEVSLGRHDVERLVRDTLAAAGVGRGVCAVHLHPSDAARLAGVSFRTGTTIESDAEVAPGDVHVTTARGLCVREIESLLDAIGERLREEAG